MKKVNKSQLIREYPQKKGIRKMKKVNKSQLIREYLASGGDQSPSRISKALRAKGVKVSPALVSVVKHARRTNARLVKNAEALKKHAPALADARKLVERAGGVQEARSLIDIVAKILY